MGNQSEGFILVKNTRTATSESVLEANKKTEQIIALGKNEPTSLTGLLTGHWPLRYHLNNMGLAEHNRCRYCLGQVETAERIIRDCEPLTMKRLQHLKKVFVSPSNAADLPPKKILKFINSLGILREKN